MLVPYGGLGQAGGDGGTREGRKVLFVKRSCSVCMCVFVVQVCQLCVKVWEGGKYRPL